MGHSRSRGVYRNWLTDAGTGVILVGHIVDRVIEVEVVVVHPVHRIAHIVRVNGQAQATLNEFSGCHPSISGSSLM